jgi:DNA invertase Pin-like site-specific DNA recombinase
VSGTTFERSGFQAMIADMEAGRLGVIIVKDLSRLGREYIQSGQYMELIFPVYGVRFIAVNNGVDSDDPNTIEVTPLLNIMNDFYARDTSRKIKAIFRSRMANGKRVSPSVPYGYLRDPEDKQHLIIDPEPAAVVRRIFQMVIDG